MAVGPDALDVPVSPAWPHRLVVVHGICQMVGDEIFARNSQVTGVPVLKLSPHLVQLGFGYAALRRQGPVQEDIVPHLV